MLLAVIVPLLVLVVVHMCLAEERLLTFVMQENCFDYGATGHSGGLRHWESQLFRLETVAEFLQRRLVLLPPALILDPKHLFGDVTHGWSLLYNRSFDDPRFRTWEDVMTTRGQMTRKVIDVRSTDAMSQLRESSAELVVLRQCAVSGSAVWDQTPLVQLHRNINGPGRRIWFGASTGKAGPPPPSYYVTAMGDRIVEALGNFVTVHVRRGDALGTAHRIFVAGTGAAAISYTPRWKSPSSDVRARELGGLYHGKYTQQDMDSFTSLDVIKKALQAAIGEAVDDNSDTLKGGISVVVFSNEQNVTYFEPLRDQFSIVLEAELLALSMRDKGEYQFSKVMARSSHSSGVFAMALNGYIAGFSSVNVCTAAATMNVACDLYLKDF